MKPLSIAAATLGLGLPLLLAAWTVARAESPGLGRGGLPASAPPGVWTAWVVQPQNPPVPGDLRVAAAQRPRRVAGPANSVANRNRNPLNIKFGLGTRHHVAAGHATLSDISPLDGGSFLRFRSPELGFRAAVDLLRSRPYDGLDLAGVFRRWTNSGFGAEILTGTTLDGRTPLRNLDDTQLSRLLGAMATAEGYRSPTLAAEIEAALTR